MVCKRGILFLSVILTVIFLGATLATGSVGPAGTVAGQNGVYKVSVQKDGKWVEAGSIPYNKYIRQNSLDLTSLFQVDEETHVRISQSGGGAAHIDAVTLGKVAPVSVDGTDDPLALTKLAARNFDVIDAYGKTLELTFPAWVQAGDLALTGRVEARKISKTPFQYPLSNLFDPMNSQSDFYTYLPGSERTGAPLFKEYWPSGSGHPSGYTIGWVSSDDNNLHVRLDFTSDNTMDGGKDYAAVYVNTPGGLKMFKISTRETKWGRPEFTYTDAVSWQHKVYNFTIPMKELAPDAQVGSKEIQLAFAAYGTSSPAQYGPDLAYDPVNSRYLAVFSEEVSGEAYNIVSRFYNAMGDTIGPDITISSDTGYERYPAVAFNEAESRYLVVWRDTRGTSVDIYGQVLDADGSFVGISTQSSVNFPVCDEDSNQGELDAAPVSGSGKNRFIVVWEDYRGGTADIYGQLLDRDGNPVRSPTEVNLPISTNADGQDHPRVAFDDVNGRAMAVMESGNDITAQIIDGENGSAVGTSVDTNFIVSDAVDTKRLPSAAFDGSGHYLVVWGDYREGEYDIYAQLLDAGGSLAGASSSTTTNVLISGAPRDQRMPDVGYDTDDDIYLVVWEDFRSSVGNTLEKEIYGQFLDAEGNIAARVSTADIFIADVTDEYSYIWANPKAAYNASNRSFLVAYQAEEFPTVIEVVQVPVPSELQKDLSGGGGGSGGCSTTGPSGSTWPGLLWIALLGAGFFLWRRKTTGE